MANKYKAYFAIEKKLRATGWYGDRAELIESFTNGRKSSLRELTDREYKTFIAFLTTSGKQVAEDTGWQNSPENKMRRKVYSLFVYKMHYTPLEFQKWIVKYGKFHKPLQEHTHDELVELVSQAEKVYQSYINEINK